MRAKNRTILNNTNHHLGHVAKVIVMVSLMQIGHYLESELCELDGHLNDQSTIITLNSSCAIGLLRGLNPLKTEGILRQFLKVM
jgi:hypothetical protein